MSTQIITTSCQKCGRPRMSVCPNQCIADYVNNSVKGRLCDKCFVNSLPWNTKDDKDSSVLEYLKERRDSHLQQKANAWIDKHV